MMTSYGLQKKMILKKELLLLLSGYTTFVSSKEIAQQLKLESAQQVQLLCRELAADIEEFYQPTELNLQINNNGILLVRGESDLQRLLTHYHAKEPSFDLVMDLFFHRVIPLADFCSKHFMSESTVRRKVRQVNKNLKAFEIRITCSHELKLIGEEHKILSFIVLAAYLSFQKMSNTTIVPRHTQTQILAQTRRIVATFSDSPTELEIDSIALIYSILAVSTKNGHHLEETWHPFTQITADFLPEKPEFLTKWTQKDWEFFLTALYLYNFYLPPHLKDHLPACCGKVKKDWEDLFIANFSTDLGIKKAHVQQELQRLFLFCDWYPNDNYILELFPVVSLEEITKRYPLHLERYDLFWSEFMQNYPAFNLNYFRVNSLLLTLYLTPLEERKERIIIYLESAHNISFVENLKIAIYEYFWIKYQIVFTDNKTEADLYLSSIKQLSDSETNEVISIHPLLLTSDFQLIEQKIQDVIENKKSPSREKIACS